MTLSPQSASGSAATQVGTALGTPAYMSPEQAEGRLEELGPASDVFSLGATLFFILTGRAPHRGDDYGEILRRVSTGEFDTPRSVNPRVSPSLEAICLKAMSVESSDRYESPAVLAEEIERYLADQPLKSVQEPVVLRTKRWFRNHPRTVGSIAATLLIGLISGVVVSSVVTRKNQDLADANRRLDVSNRELVALNDELNESNEQLTQANEKERMAKERADEERSIAQAVRDFLENDLLRQAGPLTWARSRITGTSSTDATTDTNDELSTNDPRVSVLLERAMLSLAPDTIDERFGDQEGVQADLLSTIGSAFFEVGHYRDAILCSERAVLLWREIGIQEQSSLFEEQLNLDMYYRCAGRYGDAIKLLSEMLDTRRRVLGEGHRDTRMVLYRLLVAYRDAGRGKEASELSKQARSWDGPLVIPPDNHARFGSRNRSLDPAILLYNQVENKMDRIAGERDPVAMTMRSLADAYIHDIRNERAIIIFEKMFPRLQLTLGQENPGAIVAMRFAAHLYSLSFRIEESIDLYELAVPTMRRVLGRNHPVTSSSLKDLAKVYQTRASLNGLSSEELSRQELMPEAKVSVLAPIDKVSEISLYVLARLHYLIDMSEHEEKLLRQLVEQVRSQDSEDHGLAFAQHELGRCLARQKKFETATTVLRDALATSMRIQPKGYQVSSLKSEIGDCLIAIEQYDEAELLLIEAYEGLGITSSFANLKIRAATISRLVRLYEATERTEEVKKWKRRLSR